MSKFNYDDLVRVSNDADQKYRPGAIASVIAIYDERPSGSYFDQFPDGIVYSIEFEDGEAIEIHESELQLAAKDEP